MKTLILDGFARETPLSREILQALTSELGRRGRVTTVLRLRELPISLCRGCFGCWDRTPGLCAHGDDASAVNRAYINSSLVILLTPVTFGGYSSDLKKAVDRMIGLVSPLFTLVEGEVHHRKRYLTYPDLVAIGTLPAPDGEAEALFTALVHRNVLNFHSGASAVRVLIEGEKDRDLSAMMGELLDDVAPLMEGDDGAARTAEEMWRASGEVLGGPALPVSGAGRALLLLGSPRTRSTSASLGQYLLDGLRRMGWETETMRISTTFETEEALAGLFEEVEEADLLILSFPLYVDSMPAPVIKALEYLALRREGRARRGVQGLAAIVNNGFPEVFHNHTALAQARRFSREAGFVWMGGLALGMGSAVDGRPLPQGGLLLRKVRRSLDLAAESLGRGERIPEEASSLMAGKMIPTWLYILTGNRGWRKRALKKGAGDDLDNRPLRENGGG